MPSETRAAKVDIPEAAFLADLYGIGHDLDMAEEWCKKVSKETQSANGDPWLNEAITTGAIVKYCRCFTTGVRFGLKRTDIENIGEDLLQKHDYIKALRDKFIAHPVNPFDESYVTVSITVKDGESSLGQIIHAGHTRLLLSAQEADELLEVIVAVKKCVNKIISNEEVKLRELISDLPNDVWSQWDLHSPSLMNRSDVNKKRKHTLTRGSSSTR